MQGGIAAFVTGLENAPFVEHLSKKLQIEPLTLLKRGGGLAVALCALIAAFLFFNPAEGSTDILEIEEDSSLALQSSTEFDTTPAEAPATSQTVMAEEEYVVYVSGSVGEPGVYTLKSTQRVADAVDAAGGLLPEAARAVVNFAQPLSDGMQIHIPRVNEVASDAPGEGLIVSLDPIAENASSLGSDIASQLVNINTADSKTLQTLEGVGPATAQKIIDYRTSYGNFKTKEDLLNVSGIGEKKYAALEARITV